ncbi:putative manganese transporter [Allobaculum stercoricanis]|uniref:putative manganese transporter n=1 Tax=Allobaculum stercoricanis TaxID=174709 RepID=UPI00248DE3D1|nr:putative manganese transporter [Allobaculum stercoricanis]
MEILIDSLMDAVKDTWLMLPLLYVVYLFLDAMQRRSDEDDSIFWRLQKYGPLFGALLGLIPQCGFSILAAMLFVSKNITLGTMIAVFLATSDEAIPILLANPNMLSSLLLLLVCKFVIAALVGMFIDRVLFPHQKLIYFSELPNEPESEEEFEIEQYEEEFSQAPSCACCYPQYPVWLSALIRTLRIYAFVFIVTFGFNVITLAIGHERLSSFLQSSYAIQPLLASLFGFIPNCAATVILCELFANGTLTFASLLAGLMTNAGLGLVALFQYDPNRKQLWKVILLMLIPSLLCGYLIQWLLPLF